MSHPPPSRPVLRLRLPPPHRPFRWSVVFSVAVHVLVLALLVGHEIARRNTEPFQESRAPGLPGERGGGGGGVTYRIELPPMPEAQRPAIPVEKPVPKSVQPPPIKFQKLDVPLQSGTVSSS